MAGQLNISDICFIQAFSMVCNKWKGKEWNWEVHPSDRLIENKWTYKSLSHENLSGCVVCGLR